MENNKEKYVELSDDELSNVTGGLAIVNVFTSFLSSFIKKEAKEGIQSFLNNNKEE